MHFNIWTSFGVRPGLTWILAICTVAACTGSATPPLTPKSTSVPIPTQKDTTTAGTDFLATTFGPGEERFSAQITSSVELLGDSTTRVDSTYLKSQIAVTFATREDASHVTATVHIDSASMRSSNAIAAVTLSSQSSVFKIDRRTGQVKLEVTDPRTSCTEGGTAVPFSGIEVLPIIRRLEPASTWVDTTSTQVCRGTVLLSVRRIATYTVANKVRTNSAQIFRSVQVTVNGSGTQWSQKVTVSGNGIASDTLFFGSLGRLERVSGTSRLTLVFRSAFRTQQFLQTATTTVSAIQAAK
jgi:hypothetical protein